MVFYNHDRARNVKAHFSRWVPGQPGCVLGTYWTMYLGSTTHNTYKQMYIKTKTIDYTHNREHATIIICNCICFLLLSTSYTATTSIPLYLCDNMNTLQACYLLLTLG